MRLPRKNKDDKLMKDRGGKIMTHKENIMERWRDNFEEIPNMKGMRKQKTIG